MTASNHYITHAPATVNRNADQPGNPRSNPLNQPGKTNNPRHPSPTFPDLSSFGKSRCGRRAALAAHHLAMRRYTGRPPKSGPPRRYYTLERARIGGIKSGAPRRFQARDRHQEVRALRTQGRSLRDIARIVGHHAPTVSRLLAGHIRSCLPYSPRHGGLGWFPGYADFHVVGNDQSFRRVEPEDAHRHWRATP